MGKVVLTDQKKKMATTLYASGGVSVSDIARMIGVSQSALSAWLNNQPWYVVRRNVRGKKAPVKKHELQASDIVSANKDTDENVFVIPDVIPGLNEYIKALNNSRYEGNKLKSDTEDYICRCINSGLGKTESFDCVVQVHITFVEKNRKRDYDNITSGTKFILDAMRKAGVIYNDGQSFLMPCTYDYKVDADHPRVEVKITPYPEMKIPKSLIRKSPTHKATSLRYMSDGEIRQAYRLAADKKQQIKILAQLNAMSVRAVEEIVGV
jgi:Holliday junction resolvase RusA-like endonuclease